MPDDESWFGRRDAARRLQCTLRIAAIIGDGQRQRSRQARFGSLAHGRTGAGVGPAHRRRQHDFAVCTNLARLRCDAAGNRQCHEAKSHPAPQASLAQHQFST